MDSRSATIAIADDHLPSRKVIRHFLSRGNFDVIMEADNGRRLCEQLEAAPVLPDLCVIDINMPELNGYETTKMLKQKWPSIKVLAISSDNRYNQVQLKHVGADGFIHKNCTMMELKEAVLKLLRTNS